MKLVIAEKPSVAQSLAAVLGAKEREQGYLQGNGYVVSWCVGHLIGLAAADSYDPKYSKWCYEDLPIIPKQWKYAVAPDKKEQYEVLVSLMNRPDVESLVCATDAGREGELIFRLVYDHAGCRKPFERLWISSMLPDSPACKSSWLKRQYKAVILSDCNISASFPTARQANMCRTDVVPHILYRISFCLSAGFGLTGSNRRVFGALHDFLADHLRQFLFYWLGRPFAGRRTHKVGHFAYLTFRCLFQYFLFRHSRPPFGNTWLFLSYEQRLVRYSKISKAATDG